MSSNSEDLNVAMQAALSRVENALPEVRALMDRARAGVIDQETLKQDLLQLTILHGDSFSKRLGLLESGMPATDTAKSIPRLNPAYEAFIVENAQFDGDLPHLRTGPMPRAEGVSPAVPVQTDSRSLVAVGLMLDSASARMQNQIDTIEEAHAQAILTAAETGDWSALAPQLPEHVRLLLPLQGAQLPVAEIPPALLQRDLMPDPQGYARGALASPMVVPQVDGGALAAVSREMQHKAAWRALSTSQGRRSVTGAIAQGVCSALCAAGHRVQARTGDGVTMPVRVGGAVLAVARYTLTLSGPNTMNPNFSPVDAAIASIVNHLCETLPADSTGFLDVATINAIDMRSVGWGARVSTT